MAEACNHVQQEENMEIQGEGKKKDMGTHIREFESFKFPQLTTISPAAVCHPAQRDCKYLS